MRNVGSVLGNWAFDGMPGMLSAPPALEASCAAVRETVRRGVAEAHLVQQVARKRVLII